MEFDTTFQVRLNLRQINSIKQTVSENPDLFETPSHFVRCAIIREIRRIDKRRKTDFFSDINDFIDKNSSKGDKNEKRRV